MDRTVFFHIEFWLLVFFSLVLPVAIYWWLFKRRATSPIAVLFLGLALVAIAGIDVFLLQTLSSMARLTPSLMDDAVFGSEITVALYALPALIGGVGVNVISHALIRHLESAEESFEEEERRDA
jgi:hypothetical protein